jgi:hypothetical protein
LDRCLSLLYRTIGVLILALTAPVIGGATSIAPGPAVQLSAASLTFQNRATGTLSPAQSVTLTNTGDATLTIASIVQTGSNPSDFIITNHCGVFVEAGASCTVTVVFNPSAPGSRTASLVINDSAVDSPQTIALSGTATIAGPVAAVSTTALSFAGQAIGTSSPPQTIILSNNGTAQQSVLCPLEICSSAVGCRGPLYVRRQAPTNIKNDDENMESVGLRNMHCRSAR